MTTQDVVTQTITQLMTLSAGQGQEAKLAANVLTALRQALNNRRFPQLTLDVPDNG